MLKIDLTGKLAVVTGGSGQLGRVMVRTLAQCGADVAIHYNQNADKANELADELRAMGRKTMTVQADVGDEASVFAMRDAIRKELGDPHILVNNAVRQYSWRYILDQPIADFDSQYRSSVLQNVLMAKAFVPAMIERKAGRIIAINTICAMQNAPDQGAYVSGKRGMDGVLRILAKEIGEHQITVNQVAPGWTISDRDREAGISPKEPERYTSNVPLRRRGDDQDIANAVAFLASDLASYISGLYLPVCGGLVMPTI